MPRSLNEDSTSGVRLRDVYNHLDTESPVFRPPLNTVRMLERDHLHCVLIERVVSSL
jgi:hypothetical protein